MNLLAVNIAYHIRRFNRTLLQASLFSVFFGYFPAIFWPGRRAFPHVHFTEPVRALQAAFIAGRIWPQP
jgi:hypothetical protein